ncbi:MAG: transcription termination factor Rho [Lachnospiraceae bacterium]|nr:transcription termination factor Rho [Lachnospiraceae bacterium]
MKGISTLRKAQLIDAMVAQDEKEGIVSKAENAENNQKEENSSENASSLDDTPEWVDVFAGPEVSEPYPAELGDSFSTYAGAGEPFSTDTGTGEVVLANTGAEEPFSADSEAGNEFSAASKAEEEEQETSGAEKPGSSSQEEVLQEEKTAESAENTVSDGSREKDAFRNETVKNRTESGRSEERTYRNTRTTGQTDDSGRNTQRRRRVAENDTRSSSYDRGNGERRTYDRNRTRTDQNSSYDNRRSYGNQNNSYDNRRNYSNQNNSYESRRNYGEQNNSYDNRRNYGEQNNTYDNRRNYGEQNNFYSEQDITSDARRNSIDSNSSNDNRKNSYGEQEGQIDTRRNDSNQDMISETLGRYESAGSTPEMQAPAEQRLTDADRPPAELSQLDSGQSVSGILEVMPDGYGFIRSDNYLPGENDVYVSPSQIRRFNLKTGDIISGNTRIKSQQEKFSALLYLKKINGLVPSEAMKRYNFEDMTPIFPNERLRMERDPRGIAMRIVDLFSPIGKGQRGMIVSPPKAGKTTLLKDVARSILKNNPEMRLLILLIDERPEEVTDIKEAIRGENVEVIYSTFDETPEHHKRVSEMVIERAKRLVEQKQDVTILLDSITRLARAYNLTVPPSGRTLSGGLDPAALHMPKRFFGAARNMREGGSLTILATALVDTGSKMDDVVYEEFKGTGNMELVLDRKLSERRVFPAIDIPKSGTRREDLLLDREEQEAIYYMRRALNGMKSDDAVESILNMLMHTRDNRDFVTRVRRQKGV